MLKTTMRFAGLLVLLGLLLVPTTALAQQTRIAVSPAAGPVGTQFTITGTGFAPNTAFFVEVRRVGTNTATGSRTVTTNATGSFTLTYDSEGDAPDTYRVSATLVGGTGQATATATFEVTFTSGQPGMPRTGGGGTASGAERPWLLASALGLLALAGLGATAVRRRRVA